MYTTQSSEACRNPMIQNNIVGKHYIERHFNFVLFLWSAVLALHSLISKFYVSQYNLWSSSIYYTKKRILKKYNICKEQKSFKFYNIFPINK